MGERPGWMQVTRKRRAMDEKTVDGLLEKIEALQREVEAARANVVSGAPPPPNKRPKRAAAANGAQLGSASSLRGCKVCAMRRLSVHNFLMYRSLHPSVDAELPYRSCASFRLRGVNVINGYSCR